MIVSHTRKFIFVHIHKTGGESVSAALKPYLGGDDVLVIHGADMALAELVKRHRRHGLHKHSPAADIKHYVGDDAWQAYLKFAVVREPIDRAYSLYKYIARIKAENSTMVHKLWYQTFGRGQDPKRWPAMRAFDECSDFAEFIRHPLTLEDAAMTPQWASLVDHESDCLVDIILRTEALDEGFSKLVDQLGLPSAAKLPHENASPQVRDETIGEADIAYLKDLFSIDFERLGY